MNSIAGYGARNGDNTLPVATVATSNGIFDRHRQFPPSTSLFIDTSFADGDYRLASMCSSPVMVGVGGAGGGGVGGGGVGVRPSSVETDESIVSRSPDADRDPIDDQDDLSDRVLDQILREHGGTISFGNAVQSFESCFEPTPFQSKAKSKRSEGSLCRVCGDEATGMYFGALVCVPCKTFYLRYAGSNQSFSCKEKRCCAITVASRTNCKFCRYQKCIRVGMHRKERPCQVHVTDGQHVCSVCHDVANGVHFGVITCEGCKKFFRRGLVENHSYICKNNARCEVNPRTRNACRFCRYQKCLHVGMSREAIQMGRPSKPRFEKDSSSSEHESLVHSAHPPPLLNPLLNPLVVINSFDSSVNHRTNNKQTTTTMMNGRCNLASSASVSSQSSVVHRSSMNSILPFSQPLLNHLIINQQQLQQQHSMSTNSSSHSSGKVGLRFPVDVIQKTQPKENRWNIISSSAYQQTKHQQQHQHQHQPLSLLMTTRDAAAAPSSSSSANLWSSIDSLNGGEMLEVTINDEDRVSPKQEFQFLDDFSQTVADNDQCDNGQCDNGRNNNGRCFGFYSSDDGSSVAADQLIPTDYFVDKQSGQTTAAAEDAGQQLMWSSVGRQRLSSSLSSSSSSRVQNPMTLATVLSSSPSMTKPRTNSFSSLSARFNEARLSCGKSVKTSTSASLPNNASISIELPIVTVATDDDDDHDDDASDNELNDALTATHPHPPPHPPHPHPPSSDEISRHRIYLQFPLKSVIKIIHSSVANELPDDTKNCQMPMNIEELMNRYKNYWLYDEQTTAEDPFIVHYSNIYQEVIAAYKTFVIHSQYVNFLLRTELEKCQSASNYNVVDVQWIQDNVVPFYVELSIRYCRQLPGFSSFDLSDQQMLIRLGQSPSRILAAAVHWYRPDKRDFGDFLSWRRNDQFKRLMVEHATKIHALDLDLVEAALLNAALIIATDYPNLVNAEPIERQHQDLLSAYKTYTTGKLGTPNDRFQTVISHMREVRHLGFLHYEMTKTKNMMAEDVTQPR